jgi:hypothetical protein
LRASSPQSRPGNTRLDSKFTTHVAQAPLAVAAALDRDAHASLETGLIPVTIPEMLRMLRGTVIPPPRRDYAHRQHWSQWRRRHQYRASQAHQRWNAYADATP